MAIIEITFSLIHFARTASNPAEPERTWIHSDYQARIKKCTDEARPMMMRMSVALQSIRDDAISKNRDKASLASNNYHIYLYVFILASSTYMLISICILHT